MLKLADLPILSEKMAVKACPPMLTLAMTTSCGVATSRALPEMLALLITRSRCDVGCAEPALDLYRPVSLQSRVESVMHTEYGVRFTSVPHPLVIGKSRCR